MNEKQELAKRIRSARELAGLSQGQAAKLMELHRPTISEIEAGRRNVKTDELNTFADLYGVEVSWLVSGKVDSNKMSSRVMAAARELSSMKEEDLDMLMDTIQLIKSKGRNVKKD